MYKHNSRIPVVLFPICNKQINKKQKICLLVNHISVAKSVSRKNDFFST